MDSSRIRPLKQSSKKGPVVYWMYRDQRADDNWALLYAQEVAEQQNTFVVVISCLRADLRSYSGTSRMLEFLGKGLVETASDLSKHQIPFELLIGEPTKIIPVFLHHIDAGTLVMDMTPLNDHKRWSSEIAATVECSVVQVDAHNIVPVWIASIKQEWGAYTLRPKINQLLPKYLTNFPPLKNQVSDYESKASNLIDTIHKVKVDTTVNLPKEWLPGSKAAHKVLRKFVQSKLSKYETARNDPTVSMQSNLSPYLHFGQISPQRVAYEISKQAVNSAAYVEELVVRRELADNYCWYNQNYDNPHGFPEWAQKTLAHHKHDSRVRIYTLEELESAQTGDIAWNAAQTEMVVSGKMHGYMRMYWAKKLLEWTNNVSDAQKFAINLNNKYELDGRDPNGYTGIAWSLGGVHDRPWFDRPIIGTIRPMTTSGLKKKFNLDAYVEKWSERKSND